MAERAESKELVVIGPAGEPTLLPMPAAAVIVLRQTPSATFAAEEFFKATLNNEHTRRAYSRIAGRFLTWCNDRGLELREITPVLAGEYLSQLDGSASTKNQALAALRHFFEALVQRHAVALNPFASVRGAKYSVTDGRTAELAIEQARRLFK
jgi:site-specific recombinase XerD